MNCHVCSQWNPKGPRRRAFCGNDPADADDQTASGEPPQLGQAKPTRRPRKEHAHTAPVSPPQEEPLTLVHYVGLGLLGVGLLMVLLGLLVRC